MENIKIAGVVVLYNPDHNVIKNIKSYINEIEILYIIDNTEEVNKDIKGELEKLVNIKYIEMGDNKGLAKAINIGAKYAILDGYEWLLTMDQDSKAHLKMIDKMKEYIIANDISTVGIISPYHKTKLDEVSTIHREIEEKISVMTSGNLLNLNIYRKIGGFLDELFIDSLDHEYCYRLLVNKYKIIQINSAILHHELGDITKKMKIFNRVILITNHNPVRRYYIVRNELYIRRIYRYKMPQLYKRRYLTICSHLLQIILFEKEKIMKIKYVYKGFRDFKNGKMGKLIEPE